MNVPYGLVQNPDKGKFRVVQTDGRGHGVCSEPMTEKEAKKQKAKVLLLFRGSLKSRGKVWVEEIPLLDRIMPWAEVSK